MTVPGSNYGAEPTVLVRREAWALESANTFDPITLAYAEAIKVMQARPASDPTSWTYQAAIHASFAAPPQGATWNACQHRSWFFLPWHRMYLYYFERIVRKAVVDAGGQADFALPYWNYDQPFPGNTLPPAFRVATLPDGTANPLFVPSPGRSAGLMSGGQVPTTATSSTAAMAMTNFSSSPPQLPSFGGGQVGPAHFGTAIGALETTPHNVMHPTIGGPSAGQCQGGLMTDPRCAALDPIFWLHHANIDRLWNAWLAQEGGRVNPPEPGWLTESFVFHDEAGAQVTLSGADLVDTAGQLGYVYDDEPSPVTITRMATTPPPTPPSRPPELAAASEEPVELAGTRASVSLTVPSSARSLVTERDEARQVIVAVEDIEAEQDPGLAYAVYLDIPGDVEERRHIGNVSFFGIETMDDPDQPHNGTHGLRYTFDATEAVNALQRRSLWDPESISVTFEPITLLPPPGEELPEETERTVAAAAVPVKIGRVSLFVA